jgi:hypothetical protein
VGLVRLRVRRASGDLERVLASVTAGSAGEIGIIEDLTEADIESLFK